MEELHTLSIVFYVPKFLRALLQRVLKALNDQILEVSKHFYYPIPPTLYIKYRVSYVS